MKRTIQFSLMTMLLLFMLGRVSAQTVSDGELSPCLALLRDGLRDTYATDDHVSFFSDSKHYFASDEFKSDYHNGKWNGGISVVVDGMPLGLNAGASNETMQAFQKKIRESSSVTVQLLTYSTISKSTINVDLANSFNACVEVSDKFGLSIVATGEKNVAVTIKYRELGTPTSLPTIASVDLVGVDEKEKRTLLATRLKPGTPLGNQLSFTVTRKPGEEFLIAVNTSNGLSLIKRLESEEEDTINNTLPIGTVIASVFDFSTFSAITKSNGTSAVWSVKSKWAPCDGRSVVGSKYQTKWAGALGPNVPDFRGVFMRGLNKFDPLESSAVSSTQANPNEPATKNQVQLDAVGKHSHTIDMPTGYMPAVGAAPTSTNLIFIGDRPAWNNMHGVLTAQESPGSTETRPKNISVYYYIKIN